MKLTSNAETPQESTANTTSEFVSPFMCSAASQPDKEMSISSNTSPHVFSALLWLNLKLLLNDYKKYIIAVLALGLWIFLCILYSSLSFQTKCPDGSYASYSWVCIDNNDPPSWYPSYDSAVMGGGFFPTT